MEPLLHKQKAEGDRRPANWRPDVFAELEEWQRNHWQMGSSADNCSGRNCYWTGSDGDLGHQGFRGRGTETGEIKLKLEQVGGSLEAKIIPIMVLFQTSGERLRWLSCQQDWFTREYQNPLHLAWERDRGLHGRPAHFRQERDEAWSLSSPMAFSFIAPNRSYRWNLHMWCLVKVTVPH